MKPKRTARLFGTHGAAQELFLEESIAIAKDDLLEMLRNKGWLPIKTPRVNIQGGFIVSNFSISVPAVFRGKKRVLTEKPLNISDGIVYEGTNIPPSLNLKHR